METFTKTALRTSILIAALAVGGSASALAADATAEISLKGATYGAETALQHRAEDACQTRADELGVRLTLVQYERATGGLQVRCAFDSALQVAALSVESTQDENFGSL